MNPLHTPIPAAPSLRGDLVRPGDGEYDAARRVHSPMVDRRPGAIVRAADVDDVVATVAFARDAGLSLAVRGGGHSPFGVVDDGVVLDVRGLDAVVVDASTGTVRVGGGVLGGALDAALAREGLALTSPRFPSVGVAGFTLGSGSGWLERVMGLAGDRLLEATVVTAGGGVVRASASSHPDLFWALRGGGGNFGVVTELEFAAMPLGPVVRGGMRVYPFARVREVAAAYGEVMAAAPDELCGGLIVRCAPPRPGVPEALQGEPIVVLVALWAGDVAGAATGLAPLDALGEPLLDTIGDLSYEAFGQMLLPPPEALAAPPQRGHAKFGFLDDLGPRAIETVAELGGELCTKDSFIILQPLGGALARVPSTATALDGRDARFAFQIVTSWPDPADDASNIAWTRAAAAELLEVGRAAPWPNFVTEVPAARLGVPYAPATLDRLRTAKAAWDPSNLFRTNHNIRPRA